jgi:hypothetical protein
MTITGLILFILIAAVISLLGALPLSLDICGGKTLRVQFRYLCFRHDVSGVLSRLTQKCFVMADLISELKMCASFARPPLKAARFRLKMAFSSGDAAETALLHGFLCIFFRSLYTRFNIRNAEISLNPRFLSYSELSIDCDIVLSLPMAVFTARTLPLIIRRQR